jgi:hypothetical protein
MSTRTLWCIVEGQSTPFEVTVPSDATIGQLKKKVHQEKHKLTFREVDPADLVLLQVSPSMGWRL